MVAALAPHVPLRFLVRDEAAAQEARDTLHDLGVEVERLRFHTDPHAAFFLQDAAVFALDRQGRTAVVDLKWSGHGLAAWCERRHAGRATGRRLRQPARRERDTLSRTIAVFAGAQVIDTPLHLEGGGVEVNGRGVMIANEALLRSRNPRAGASADLQRALLRLPGVRKIVWLPEGPAEDPHLRATITDDYVGWGTGGHTDQFVRFADARTVLLAWVSEAQAAAHPVARLTRQRMQRNLEILSRATDLEGRPFRIVKVPMPRTLERPRAVDGVGRHALFGAVACRRLCARRSSASRATRWSRWPRRVISTTWWPTAWCWCPTMWARHAAGHAAQGARAVRAQLSGAAHRVRGQHGGQLVCRRAALRHAVAAGGALSQHTSQHRLRRSARLGCTRAPLCARRPSARRPGSPTPTTVASPAAARGRRR